jgi:pyruvate dehydrogenase E2 component (dihydrolipoyllysine-residue acetyltransferase)
MPALSPTMEKGNLVEWKKSVGEKIEVGEIIAVIETDKATIDWESTEEGYLAAILVEGGTNELPCGTAVGIFVEDENDIAAFANFSSSDAADATTSEPSPSSSSSSSSAPEPAPASLYPEHIELGMPALSPTMDKGNVVEWKKSVGEQIVVGEVIAVIETDKATIDLEATDDGILAAIVHGDGSTNVPVGQVIGIIVENEADLGAFASYEPPSAAAKAADDAQAAQADQSAAAKAKTPASVVTTANGAPSPQRRAQDGDRVFASPRARKLATEKGYNLSSIAGTGPAGRIIERDVLAYEPAKASDTSASSSASATGATATLSSTPAPSGADFELIPNSNIRKVIARRLTESKQNVPHYYLTIECNVDALLETRAQMNADANGKYKLSVNDFIVKAAAIALRQVPEVNSQWTDDAIRRFSTIDINVAVNAPQGLLTPLVRNADNLGLVGISSRVRELADLSTKGSLPLEDQQPGTFTISNLGMFGISQFAAVINPPQACILAVGAAEKRVILNEDDDDDESDTPQFSAANIMTVTLSCDHRVVDGAVGATWLQKFKKLIERPIDMILH